MSPILPTVRSMPRAARRGAALALCWGLLACTSVPGGVFVRLSSREPDVQVLHRAESERAEQLEREIERLRADLKLAEEALIAVESGLRGQRTRADAVSSLAEARIQVKRAEAAAPWRGEQAREAWRKLDESVSQLNTGHFGSAIFFSARARRIADALLREARAVKESDGHSFVLGARVNLRSGPSTDDDVIDVLVRDTPVIPERRSDEWVLVRTPSGRVGWIHESLLRSG